MNRGMLVAVGLLAVVGCKQEAKSEPERPPPPASRAEGAHPIGGGEQTIKGNDSAAQVVDPKHVARCASESNSVVRLACYDALAAASGLSPRSEPLPAPSSGSWRPAKNVDPLNDKTVYFAMLDADSGRGKYGDRIGLVVRCKDNRTEFFVNWESYLGMDTTLVTHRIDKEKAVRSRWDISTDRKSSFFPGSPVPMLKRLAESTSFVVNVTPYGESPVTATFNTTGAGEALAELRKACNW